MLEKKHKLLELKTKALVDSLFVWNYKTKHKWNWIEFVDFKEYSYWDLVKNIDFVKSAKVWKTLVKLFEEEKELSVYFVLDVNNSFIQEYNSKTKKDILLEIFYLIWLTCIKSWDKIWTLINYNKNELYFAKKWKQNFINIVNNIEKNFTKIVNKSFFENIKNIFKNKWNTNPEDSNILSYFNSLKIKNSLVFYLTDKLDINSKDLKIISKKNDFILCNIFNSFENDLSWDWIIWVDNLDIKIDLNSIKKIDEYKKMRFEKIKKLRQQILKYSWDYIMFDETKSVYKEFYKLFTK